MAQHVYALITAGLLWLLIHFINDDVALGAVGSIVGFVILELFFYLRKNTLDITRLGLSRLLYLTNKQKIINRSDNSDSLSDFAHWLEVECGFPLLDLNRRITSNIIQKLSNFESALFILLVNNNNKCLDCTNISADDFRFLFTKALKERLYRKLILKEALSQLVLDKSEMEVFISKIDLELSLENEISDRDSDDDAFRNKVRELCIKGSSINLSIFSTTSQLSHKILQDLKAYQNKNTSVNVDFYICSPYVGSHNACVNLMKEYDVPKGALPLQFVKTKNGEVYEEMDVIRRVFRILRSLKDIKHNEESVCKTAVCLYKESYPGSKIRLIENEFIEIQPGSLKFANNLYRYKLESTDTEVIKIISNAIKSYKDSDKIQYIDLIQQPFEQIEKKALLELAVWLLSKGIKSSNLSEYLTEIHSLSGDQEAGVRIDFLKDRIELAYKEITNLSSFGNAVLYSDNKLELVPYPGRTGIKTIDSNGKVKHITVAAVFTNENQILLIEKAKEFYQNKFSLVAGHVEYCDENLLEAVSREIKEEIGLKVDHLNYIFHIDDLPDKCGHDGELHDWHVFNSYELIDISQLELSDEIKSVKWVSMQELATMETQLTDGASKIFKAMGWLK